MRAELFGILAVGLAAAALIMARIRSRRKSMRTEIHDLTGTRRRSFVGVPGPPLTEATRQRAAP